MLYVDPINRLANAPAFVRFNRFPSSLITLNEPEQLTGLLRAQGPDRAQPFGWDLGCNPSPCWMILLREEAVREVKVALSTGDNGITAGGVVVSGHTLIVEMEMEAGDGNMGSLIL